MIRPETDVSIEVRVDGGVVTCQRCRQSLEVEVEPAPIQDVHGSCGFSCTDAGDGSPSGWVMFPTRVPWVVAVNRGGLVELVEIEGELVQAVDSSDDDFDPIEGAFVVVCTGCMTAEELAPPGDPDELDQAAPPVASGVPWARRWLPRGLRGLPSRLGAPGGRG